MRAKGRGPSLWDEHFSLASRAGERAPPPRGLLLFARSMPDAALGDAE